MRFETTSGKFVTAATKAEASEMAAHYGMGDVVRAVSAPASAQKQMPLKSAVCLYAQAQEWPRCGQDWPKGHREVAAAAVIAANPGCTDEVW